MTTYEVNTIGIIRCSEEGFFLCLDKRFIPALEGLDGFSHLQVLWWFSDFDSAPYRTVLQTEQPYKNAPERMGIFATRSPIRPNPIGLTAVEILAVSYTHLRAHETGRNLVCRLLLEKKKPTKQAEISYADFCLQGILWYADWFQTNKSAQLSNTVME